MKSKPKTRAPFFFGTEGPAAIQRAQLLARQNWRCATCADVCTGPLVLVGQEVIHGRCYVAQLRVELREEVACS